MGGPFELQKNPNGSLEEACGGAVAPPFLGSQGKGDTDKKGKLKATIFFETYIIRKLKLGKPQHANKATHQQKQKHQKNMYFQCVGMKYHIATLGHSHKADNSPMSALPRRSRALLDPNDPLSLGL